LSGVELSWAAFVVVGSGGLGCVLGGHAAQRWGSARVAAVCLGISGLCCVLAPWLLHASDAVFAIWLLVWGISAAGDSPQFSTLTARNAPAQAVGSVLTLTNSIGFAISIVSILIFVALTEHMPLGWLLTGLAIGPVLGLWAMRPLVRQGG
jgi:MFS family permease